VYQEKTVFNIFIKGRVKSYFD